MSPFVDNEAEGYVPEYAETIKRLQAAARNQVLPLPSLGMEDLEDPQSLLAEGVIDRAEANEAVERKQKVFALFSLGGAPPKLVGNIIKIRRKVIYN